MYAIVSLDHHSLNLTSHFNNKIPAYLIITLFRFHSHFLSLQLKLGVKEVSKSLDILAWLVFGLLVGTIAHIINPRPHSGGVLGAIILGIVGALVGGFMGNLLFGVSVGNFDIGSFTVAVVGSLLVIFVARVLARNT